MLNLQRLAVFREVARSGSFSAAAEHLDYSQPAISHHVAKLELEIGATLIVRLSRGLALTDTGREVLRHAETLLDLAGDAEAELRSAVSGTPERVRLGGFETGTEAVAATALECFWEAFPDTRVTLLEAQPIDHVESLLAGERWLEGGGPEATSAIFLQRTCEPFGFTPNVAFACGNYRAVQRLVAHGMGVALVPELSIGEDCHDLVVRRVSGPTPIRRIGVAALRAHHRAPHFVAMEQALATAFARYRAAPPLSVLGA